MTMRATSGTARLLLATLTIATCIVEELRAQPTPTLNYAEQGWSAADRNTFYTTSQGSQMMPFAWFKALRRVDIDSPFAADQLLRYGYLRNDGPGNTTGLPIGFVLDGAQVGMTCAACHTGQIEYEKAGVRHALRIDGAPAMSDFQQFLADLTAASRMTLANPDRFDAFARTVLGAGYNATTAADLKDAFAQWVARFGTFMDASLPASPWGPARLDAFGMIFNRVTAHDINKPENFRKADAPVSYPFLWNVKRQDRTQWNGAVPNGLFIQALARNNGEVFGVFADFKPRAILPGLVDHSDNSADFGGLQMLEEKIHTLEPPRWPRETFGLDKVLAAKGAPLFATHCSSCHGESPSSKLAGGWATPVLPVKTDPKMIDNSERMVAPGLYEGTLKVPPPFSGQLENPSRAADVLAAAVTGSLLYGVFAPENWLPENWLQGRGVWRALRRDALLPLFFTREQVEGLIEAKLGELYKRPTAAGAAYESRVLYGIWATAPYLHNGSVPSLWELLQPASQRKTTFKVGSRVFDPTNVGYVTDQTPFESGTFVADPTNANGNGNGGHEYGTDLKDPDRWAIIEYLKVIGEPL
jgi:hypothetical protein